MGHAAQPFHPQGGAVDRLRALAQAVDCFTVDDVCTLYGITEGTAEAWRKRGQGPAHIQAGTRPLYPRKNVIEDLQARSRERRGGVAASAL